ncbi:MAG: proton-conducting transporter membrane subunit [Deltaproteobacteria bacterium]|nr:proton-conducting transporter membrane subunit [Deltaproteobacteria bacterium]MDZ4347264.1 proton-conducting transporter membrane subunit [Candidatus Binatia bacterium]
MKTIVSFYPLLILLAPLLAGLIIGLLGGLIGKKVHRIGVLADVFAFGFSLNILYDVIAQGPHIVDASPFTSQWNGILQFGLYIDRLAAVMMVHITAISTLIHLFSIRYMQQERGYARFHSLLALTTFVLLGMVASANLLMLFIFWQLLSWLLTFLSYNYSHPPTVRGAFRTFTMLRLGDIAFLSAIVLAHVLYGTLDIQQLFIRATEVHRVYSLWPGWGFEINASTAITLLIFIGAMSKSAQFPLHMWLPDSLYAPTPVHALLHAGIINAGGFLLARLAPLYDLSPTTLHVVFAIGLLTALLGSSMMLTHNDIKKTLGYSTIGQMGFMIMECGLGAFALAIFHLIAHGIFKATIFLNCGNIIHAARQEPRFPPKADAVARTEFSSLTWLTGFVTTLILPLIILLAGHGVLRIPLRDSQGAVIFLFFSWVTSSQAILTLYRLRAVASWKVAATMLFTLFLVVVTYLLAAESFTYFLFPAAGEAAHHFKAGALPGTVFDFLVVAAALFIVLGWIVIYANAHGRSIRLPLWVNALQARLYLLLMNRLYLDALSLRIGQRFTRMADRLTASRLFPYVVSLTALIAALSVSALPEDLSLPKFGQFLAVASMLPLFPLHGLYVAALTRPRGNMAICFAILLPTAGLYGMIDLLPGMPADFLAGVRMLALFGALYGSFKALVQARMTPLLAYASLSFYSVLWWHIAGTRTLPPQAVVYFSAVVLITVGLLLAWYRVQARYGDLAFDRIGGLARPMPRFATLVALLTMAAVGMPPFGLFSGYIGMLLHPAIEISWDLSIILLTWFAASFYLFRMMQRLLFGPHCTDIPYEDLHRAEIVSLLIMLLILVAVGLLPYGFFESDLLASGYRTTMEMTTSWIK